MTKVPFEKDSRPRQKSGFGPALLALAGAATLLTGCGAGSPGPRMGRDPDVVPVAVSYVQQKDVPVEIQVIGNVQASSNVAVKAQVAGQILSVAFESGAYVKKGDLLFEIDRRPLEAQLREAEGNVAKSKAQMGQAQATLQRDMAQAKYAKEQAGRYASLFKEGIVSKDQADQYASNADATGQAVNADLASIESAKADLEAQTATAENIRVQLGYTKIYSPIDGRTGDILMHAGNVVAVNGTDLTTINQVQPIDVAFSVPEARLDEVKRYMAAGRLVVTAVPQDVTAQPESGVLSFIDNTVDVTTGTIKLKGTFPNTDHRLWPGQFVRVTLLLTTQPHALVVPNQAVQTGQDGSFVFVVKPDQSVESRTVRTGARVGQELVIESGLRAGETVVTEGQLRLVPGTKVIVRNTDGGGRAAKLDGGVG